MNKTYSEKGPAEVYVERMKERQHFCLESARNFLARKRVQKRYKVKVYVPDVDYDLKIVFTDEEEKKYLELAAQFRKEWEKDEDNRSTPWPEFRSDCFRAEELTIDVDFFNKEFPFPVEIFDIDTDNPENVYAFDVKLFKYKNGECVDSKEWVALTDEEYVEIVARQLDKPWYMVGALYFDCPDIYKKIMQETTYKGWESAVFMAELKDDAKAIMDETGDKMPEQSYGSFAELTCFSRNINLKA